MWEEASKQILRFWGMTDEARRARAKQLPSVLLGATAEKTKRVSAERARQIEGQATARNERGIGSWASYLCSSNLTLHRFLGAPRSPCTFWHLTPSHLCLVPLFPSCVCHRSLASSAFRCPMAVLCAPLLSQARPALCSVRSPYSPVAAVASRALVVGNETRQANAERPAL